MIFTVFVQKWIYYTALLLSFSLPLSRAGINIFGSMLLILWLLEGRFKEKFYAIINHKLTLVLSLFLLYILSIYLWIEPKNITSAHNYNIKYSYFLIIFVLFTSFAKEKSMHLLYLFLLGMFISILQSLSIYFHVINLKEVNIESLSPHMWHTIYSIFLAFSALVSFILFLNQKEYKFKFLYLILFTLITLVLFLGISRTGEAIFLLGFFIIMIKHYKLTWKSFLATTIMISLLSTTLYTQNKRFKSRIDIAKNDINLLQQDRDYCSSLGGRIFTWEVAYDVFKSDPILGLGTIDHLDFLKKAMNNNPKFSQCEIKNMIGYYHAQYIETTAQSGLVGLFFLLLIFYTLAKIRIKNPVIAYMKLILIVVFLSAFIVDVPFRKMFTLALFAIMISIILLQDRIENEI